MLAKSSKCTCVPSSRAFLPYNIFTAVQLGSVTQWNLRINFQALQDPFVVITTNKLKGRIGVAPPVPPVQDLVLLQDIPQVCTSSTFKKSTGSVMLTATCCSLSLERIKC